MQPPLSYNIISTVVNLLRLNYNQLTEFVSTSYIQDLLYPFAFYQLHKTHNDSYELNLTERARSLLTAINHFLPILADEMSMQELASKFSLYMQETKEKACYTDIVTSYKGNNKWVSLDNEEAVIVEKYNSYMQHKIDDFFGYNLTRQVKLNRINVPIKPLFRNDVRLLAYKREEQFSPILLSYCTTDNIILDLYYYNIDKDDYYDDFCLLLTTLDLQPKNRWDKPYSKFLKLDCGWFYE